MLQKNQTNEGKSMTFAIVRTELNSLGIWLLSSVVNPLWPSDAIRRHRTGTILAQVMAFLLAAIT